MNHTVFRYTGGVAKGGFKCVTEALGCFKARLIRRRRRCWQGGTAGSASCCTRQWRAVGRARRRAAGRIRRRGATRIESRAPSKAPAVGRLSGQAGIMLDTRAALGLRACPRLLLRPGAGGAARTRCLRKCMRWPLAWTGRPCACWRAMRSLGRGQVSRAAPAVVARRLRRAPGAPPWPLHKKRSYSRATAGYPPRPRPAARLRHGASRGAPHSCRRRRRVPEQYSLSCASFKSGTLAREPVKRFPVDIADAIWVATAMLHESEGISESFSKGRISDKVIKEIASSKNAGSIEHNVSVHCLANIPAGPKDNHCKMYRESRGRYRLYRSGEDDRDPSRRGCHI